MQSTNDERIRAAALRLSGLSPHFAARFTAARNLLLRTQPARRADGALIYPCGVVATHASCTCQEGFGPIVCLHRIGVMVQDLADAPPGWPATGWIIVGRTKGVTLRRHPALEELCPETTTRA